MSEIINDSNNNNANTKEWEQIALDEERRRSQEQLEGRLRNIDERVKRGSMTEEQAQATKEKIEASASNTNQDQVSQSEASTGNKVFSTFQVASGTSKEAEFKRLTGEDWPGEKYYAVTYGVDEGYDEPIENWTIYERPAAEAQQQPETITNDEVFGHLSALPVKIGQALNIMPHVMV